VVAQTKDLNLFLPAMFNPLNYIAVSGRKYFLLSLL
jgi:hypothetical protein